MTEYDIPVSAIAAWLYGNIPLRYAQPVALKTNLRQLRRAANVTQEHLAEVLGVKQGAVSKWETGKADPPASLLPIIAIIVGGRLDELLAGEFPRYDLASRGAPPPPISAESSKQAEAQIVVDLWVHASLPIRTHILGLLRSTQPAGAGTGHQSGSGGAPADQAKGRGTAAGPRKRAR